MRIIALTGTSDCGKTTTLNLVYLNVLAHGGISTNKRPLGGDPNDFSDIVLYNNQKIAFFTMGDYSGYVVNAIRDNNNRGVDLLICACNSRFVRPFTEMAKYPHNILNKTLASPTSDELTSNTNDANLIFGLI